MNRQLKREEEGLCAQRGLLKDSDVQSFEIFVSREVRDMYDRALRGAGRIAAARASRAQRDRRRRGFQSSPEDLLVRQRETNDFLTSFINTNKNYGPRMFYNTTAEQKLFKSVQGRG